MAGISTRKRKDGVAYQVRWFEGGGREGKQQYETFDQLARAEKFRVLVDEAGQHWPEGWTKGLGFAVSAPSTAAPIPDTRPTVLAMITRYVEQLTDIGPDTRSRYLRQAKVLEQMLDKPSAWDVTDEDVRHWIIAFQRGPKTIHNYHGLLSAAFDWGQRKGLCPLNPCKGNKLPRKDLGIDEDGDAVHFLTEQQFAILLAACPADIRIMVAIAVGTGLRFGELTALWAMDVDLENKTLKVRRAWKQEGDNGERPKAVKMLVKHEKNPGFYLGPPKTPKSRRTITLPDSVVDLFREAMAGLAKDDFIFTTKARKEGAESLRWAGGRAWSQVNFYEGRWKPAVDAAIKNGLDRRPRFHDLRHTFAVWLITAGTDLPVVQQKLGHESIITTSDRYGGFLIQSSAAADAAIDAALNGKAITRVNRTLRAV